MLLASLSLWLMFGELTRERGSNLPVVLKAVQAVKALGRNPIGTDVLATRKVRSLNSAKTSCRARSADLTSRSVVWFQPVKALETLVHLAALPSLSSNAPSTSTSFGSPTSDESLRVLSNVLLLHSSARKTLVELDVGPRLVGALRLLRKGDAEDRWAGRGDLIFLGSRLGFLMSVEGGEGVLKLVDAGVMDLLADVSPCNHLWLFASVPDAELTPVPSR